MAGLAAAHLPTDVAKRWLALLRPAVRLVETDSVPAVARLGGQPILPGDLEWPVWPDHGPLSYIAEIYCTMLSPYQLDIPIPGTGRLLFFDFDGSLDNGTATVGTWDVESLLGARVIYLPDDHACTVRQPPAGIATYREARFAGLPVLTAPGFEHPDLRAAFAPDSEDQRAFLNHPVNADAFAEGVYERHAGPNHQIGGYADPVQGPVEHEVALAALDNKVPYRDPRLDAEAARWELLLQIDTDERLSMMWGDCGMLYWLARPKDLGQGNIADVSFTWQCG